MFCKNILETKESKDISSNNQLRDTVPTTSSLGSSRFSNMAAVGRRRLLKTAAMLKNEKTLETRLLCRRIIKYRLAYFHVMPPNATKYTTKLKKISYRAKPKQ